MDGIIIINKPIKFTSQDVVSKTKRILNVKKAGHTGTLDPMATGVLPILLGNYTKLSKYLIEHDKTYVATVKLGEKRDTGDSEGNVVETQEVKQEFLNKENVEQVLASFLGIQKQTPPMYSAIKVNGKKLYEYARAGETIEIPEREIEIYQIKFIEIDCENFEISFEVSCSKGTYIRVLCEDIAQKLETVGYMSKLNRVLVDEFSIEKAITLEDLETNKTSNEFLNKTIITIDSLFYNLPKIELNKRKEELFLNGVMLTFEKEDGLYRIYNPQEKCMGIGIVKNHLLKRDVVL